MGGEFRIRVVEIGRAALGRTWEAQPKAKQKRFLDAFLSGFKAAIGGQLDTFRSSATTFGQEKVDSETTLVPTTFTVKGEPTEILYSMKKDPAGTWRIADITIDEVSTVENYRASFGRIVSKEGFDGLIARLKKHPASSSKGPSAAAQ